MSEVQLYLCQLLESSKIEQGIYYYDNYIQRGVLFWIIQCCSVALVSSLHQSLYISLLLKRLLVGYSDTPEQLHPGR